MGQKEPPFRQALTDRLAPDALVFINGSDTIKDDNRNVYEIRNNITDVNTSLNIDSVPGTAGFTITMPDHSIRRNENIRFNALTLMSEVEIYFKGRFPKEDEETGVKTYPYYPAFWGVIISIVENYSDGMNNISVSCADILRWWQITTVTINPAVIVSANALTKYLTVQGIKEEKQQAYVEKNQAVISEKTGRLISPHGNIYAGKTIPEILIDLAQISIENIAPIINAFDQKFDNTDKVGADLKAKAEEIEQELMKYWEARFNTIGRNLRIFGLKTVEQTGFGETKISLDQENFGNVMPYQLNESSPNEVESVSRSQLEIANELKESIQFEFFTDVNGEIIFKPPFFNLNVITNKNSIINDLDIIDWNFTTAEAEMVTRIDVSGSWLQTLPGGKDVLRGIAIDMQAAKKFGLRIQTRNINWLNSKEKCFTYAQGELNRINALARQGSISIIGRPELRLGYPIYVPSRDAFYYVKGIDHSFSFGSNFRTTLTLTAERKRVLDEDGTPYKWGYYKNTIAIEDGRIPIEGNSIAEDSGNFVKQLTNSCVPTADTFDIVEPNFVKSLDNTLSTIMGDWKRFKDLKLPDDTNTTIKYQVTDGEGYELIPFFKYGRDLIFSDKSTIDEKTKDDVVDETKQKGKKAQSLTPTSLELQVNPNNNAITFDRQETSMLDVFDTSTDTVGKKAQDVNPEKSKESL